MNDFTELIQYGIHVQAEVLLKNKTSLKKFFENFVD